MDEDLELKNRIREIAQEVIPLSVREEVLMDIDLIADSAAQRVFAIIMAMPNVKVSVDGQIRSRLLEVLHGEKIARAVYERYKKYVGNGNGYSFQEFMRQAKRSRESVIGSPFLQYLEVESKGLLPGVRITVDHLKEVRTVRKINRECRVVLEGQSNRGIKPSACSIYNGDE